jgi:hypothetical protein
MIQTVKGFFKSQNMPLTNNLLFRADNTCTSSNNLQEAFSGDELCLKPYCSYANVQFCLCWQSPEYITFLKTLKNDMSKETGLKLDILVLSPFYTVA